MESLGSREKRFAILSHDYPDPHFDFMLEQEHSLLTWRLKSVPEPSAVIEAEAIADHRIAYLDYEGPVSNNRGVVARWDGGFLQIHRSDQSLIEATLAGQHLKGPVLLRKVRDNIWELDLTKATKPG